MKKFAVSPCLAVLLAGSLTTVAPIASAAEVGEVPVIALPEAPQKSVSRGLNWSCDTLLREDFSFHRAGDCGDDDENGDDMVAVELQVIELPQSSERRSASAGQTAMPVPSPAQALAAE